MSFFQLPSCRITVTNSKATLLTHKNSTFLRILSQNFPVVALSRCRIDLIRFKNLSLIHYQSKTYNLTRRINNLYFCIFLPLPPPKLSPLRSLENVNLFPFTRIIYTLTPCDAATTRQTRSGCLGRAESLSFADSEVAQHDAINGLGSHRPTALL